METNVTPPPQPPPLNILPLQKLSRGCEQQLTLVSLDEWIKDALVTETDKEGRWWGRRGARPQDEVGCVCGCGGGGICFFVLHHLFFAADKTVISEYANKQ